MRRNLNYTLQYIFMCIVIFATDSFIVFANLDQTVKRVFEMLIIMLIVVSFILICAHNTKISLSKILIWGILCSAVILCIFVNNDFVGGNIYKVIILTFGLLYTSIIDFTSFKRVYVNIMLFICIYSLVIFALDMIGVLNTSYFPIISNGQVDVAFTGVTNLPIKMYSGSRNWGPFWEPGVYAIYLNIALIFSLSDKKAQNISRFILGLGIISTMSTTGFVVLGIIIFICFLSIYEKADNKNAIRLYIGILLICVIVFLGFSGMGIRIIGDIMDKFNPESYKFASGLSRMTSITTNMRIFCERPMLGVGAGNISELFAKYAFDENFGIPSNSNGLLMHFSMYGIFVGGIYTFCLWKMTSKMQHRYLMFAVFLVMLFSEPLILSLIFNTIIFYGFEKQENI